MKISVELDRHHPRADGTCRVRVCVYHLRRARYPLPVHVRPADWTKAGRVRAGAPGARAINAAIEHAMHRAQAIVLATPGISAQAVVDALGRRDASGLSFVEVARQDMEEAPPTYFTAKARRSDLRKFEAVLGAIRTQDIDRHTMERYRAHLVASGLSPNSVAVQLKRIRTMYRRACERLGIEPRPILRGLRAVEVYQAPPSTLTLEQVQALERYAEGRSGWAAKAVHLWLFSLYCGGVRWHDLCRLSASHLQGERLVLPMAKNRRTKNVVLHAKARAIIDRYRKGARLLGLPTDPKGIAGANALANKWLKVAARAVGITARLHTHNARHTTALWLFRAGVDDRVIQDVLGVDPKAFAHYKARITQDDRDDALRKALGGLE